MPDPGRWRNLSLGLTRSEDVLARWRVSRDDWHAFLTLERQQAQDRSNELLPDDDVPADGIEIIVGPSTIRIGESIHRLPARGTPEIQGATLHGNSGTGAPSTIELLLKYPPYMTPSSHSPPRYTRLCFPVAGPAWREARRVVAHYNADRPGTPDFFHGRGDGSDPEDLSTCWSCGFRTHKFRSECERCGASMLSRRWARRFGLGLTFCGLFITGLMSVVLYKVLPTLLRPGVEVGGARFSGSAAQALIVSVVLAAVWVFGATALVYGGWQMATGKRNLRIALFMSGIFFALLVLAVLF